MVLGGLKSSLGRKATVSHNCLRRCRFFSSQMLHYSHSSANVKIWCTRRNIFQILLNRTELRLYLPFSDWFETKRTSVWFQIDRKIVNTIWYRFDLIRSRKYFSACGVRIFLIGQRKEMSIIQAAWGGIIKPNIIRNDLYYDRVHFS